MAEKKLLKISAFGALNQSSYNAFEDHLTSLARKKGVKVQLLCAGPYPNKEARTVPGRPLRGDALKDNALKEELFSAVAADAKNLGDADIYCMPCMSMIGFQDGIEQKLGKPIIRLADALADFYRDINKLGIIHMRPAKRRIEEIFGKKAVVPNDREAERLLIAEEKAKKMNRPDFVEEEMLKICMRFLDQGLGHVLFARADAPYAQNGPAGQIDGIQINSYFDILAKYILDRQ